MTQPQPPFQQPGSYPPQYVGYALPPQQSDDVGHLNILAICHYVWGGLTILLSSCGIIYIVMGTVFMTNPNILQPPAPVRMRTTATTNPTTTAPSTVVATSSQTTALPPAFGGIFVVMGSVVVFIGWTLGILTIYSGRCLHQKKNRLFSLVMAGINCISFPVGMTLGIFTFIVLLRPSVAALYSAYRSQGAVA